MADPLPGTPPSPPPPSPVASNGPGNSSGPAPVPVSAAQSAPLFGGYRGGRPRKDGLAPGSPEAIAADREKDRQRKARSRAAQAQAQPAPLPSASQAQAVPSPAPAPAGDPPPLAAPDGSAFIPWQAGMLEPLFRQLVPAAEQMSVQQITARAEKAHLDKELIADVADSAKWNAMSKKALEASGPQVAAKWLNKMGLSAENQAEVIFGTALASIVAGQVMVIKKLDKLIASANPAPATKPAEVKP